METRAMEATMAQRKNALAEIGSDADDRTAQSRDDGLAWPLAHRVDPVWGEAVRDAVHQERPAGIATGPLLPWEHAPRWCVLEALEAEHAASGDPASLAQQDRLTGLGDAAREPLEEPSGMLLPELAERLADLSRHAEEAQRAAAEQDQGMEL